ncbi:MAG: DUF1491 family protein [Alphaproteobacteria bacterium]|nr:DUF1491 family protein [Alphaproteobacteria bacterium]
MSQPRVKSQIRVQAWLRQAAGAGLMAAVVRKGDDDAGAIILKINRFAAGCDVCVGVTGDDGTPAWLRALGDGAAPEREADAYIHRQIGYDSDVWVVEIEDPKGLFTLPEPVIRGQK